MKIVKKLYRNLRSYYYSFIRIYFPYLWAKHLYRIILGKRLNSKNPRDINEKIQWLQYHTYTYKWSELADKYAVRNYVREKVGEHVLVPLLGKWNSAEEIDFDSLPDKFVIKPNNGSFDSVIVTEKSKVDPEEIRSKMRQSLINTFGTDTAEPHYKRIKPCIIAEQLLETDEPGGLVDYKIWCFNGKPHCFIVCANRDNSSHSIDLNYHDLDWARHENYVSEEYRNKFVCPKPANLSKMIEYASKLSIGFPEVRVDFYNIHGKVYFGEMTFTASMGMNLRYTQDVLNELGDQCLLPKRTIAEKLSCFINRWTPNFR